jgi:hypothetical protein
MREWRAKARTTSAAKQNAMSTHASHTSLQHHQSKIDITEHRFNRAYWVPIIVAASSQPRTLLNHDNRHALPLPPSHQPPQRITKRDHRSYPLPFRPRNQVCVSRPSTAASHVMSMPQRWAIPQHSTVRLAPPPYVNSTLTPTPTPTSTLHSRVYVYTLLSTAAGAVGALMVE